MLEAGLYATVSEIGEAENISNSYSSRILRLALLAPESVEASLAEETGQAFKLEPPLPARSKGQRSLTDRS